LERAGIVPQRAGAAPDFDPGDSGGLQGGGGGGGSAAGGQYVIQQRHARRRADPGVDGECTSEVGDAGCGAQAALRSRSPDATQQVGADGHGPSVGARQAPREVAGDLGGLAEASFAVARRMQRQRDEAVRPRPAGPPPGLGEQDAQYARARQVMAELEAGDQLIHRLPIFEQAETGADWWR
jgi:hypothetical protein